MRPLLNDIALFVEVVTAGNFTQAAERLKMPASTLSRRIAALESHIGFKLLNRTTRRVEPTAEGLTYFQRCQSLVEEAHLAHEEIASHRSTVTGTLRVASTGDFANLYLAACLGRYLQAYPRVSVALSLSSRVEDLLAHQLDLAIRLGPLSDSALIAHPLGVFQPGLYASPQLLQERAPLHEPRDLAQWPCIRLSESEAASTWKFAQAGGSPGREQTVRVSGRLVAGGPQLATQLTAQGMGVGLLDQRLAQPLVAGGQLVPLLAGWRAAAVPVHAITLSRLMPARVRQFIDLLKQELNERPDA
ncbi:LysR family transcriptional regulator [Roseateles sp. BYS180W]|uniref:LysR family transcriptional regulator n=1 Tax=Roseateles rivi TaxID=3299028 RepID=A0ABW7FZ32_9BURK